MTNKMISTTEAAELLGYSASYVRRLLKKGTLKGQRMGHDWILAATEIPRFKNKFKKGKETKTCASDSTT